MNDKNTNWPFDQRPEAAAVSTRQVIQDGLPVLSVVHYSEDGSWSFSCGTTNDPQDLLLVAMKQVLEIDTSLYALADLPTGWCAERKSESDDWVRYQDESV